MPLSLSLIFKDFFPLFCWFFFKRKNNSLNLQLTYSFLWVSSSKDRSVLSTFLHYFKVNEKRWKKANFFILCLSFPAPSFRPPVPTIGKARKNTSILCTPTDLYTSSRFLFALQIFRSSFIPFLPIFSLLSP